MSIALLTLCALCSAAEAGAAGAGENAAGELRVFPSEVRLETTRDFQRVVVQYVRPDGITRDVAAEAEWTLANPKLVTRTADILKPAADGETTLTVKAAGLSRTIPVKVSKAGAGRPVSFKLDVMPVFSKAGCNTGSCHGAARGKDGFMLSLFGYDPDGDLRRITREQVGRRINLAVPEKSLLVEKATGAVPHTGGKLFDAGSEMAGDLTAWIAGGATTDPDGQPEPTGIALYPPQAVIEGEGATQSMTVVATYSDGSQRDVTPLAFFQSSNKGVADVVENGVLKAGTRGEAFVMARFDKFTVGSQVLTLPAGLTFEPDFGPVVNEVDRDVAAKLKKLRINPSPVSDDEEFLRRVYIDMVGLLPTVKEYEAFLADEAPDKRARLIDELMERKEFTELWVSKWAEMIGVRSDQRNRVSYKSVVLYYSWLRDQIASGVPVDRMVKDLLCCTGGTFGAPQTNYYMLERDTLKRAENVAQSFMGMRIQCAQCHNHPFDRWTQDDYYGFAAFFSQVGLKNAEDHREMVVYDKRGGEAKHPVTGKNAPPTYLGGGAVDMKVNRARDRREVMADWLVSPDNPYFASNLANRTWHHFFGKGIVDPVDDVRVTNPASNPELLQGLAGRFADSGYDFKAMVREICNSTTYQRSSTRLPADRPDTNFHDDMNFAHQTVRRIKAESMLDIISQVTTAPEDFKGLPPGARATQIADGATSTYFLTTFGRATRETVCACEVKMEPTLSQALHLLNGEATIGKLQKGKLVETLLKQGVEPRELARRLYVRCFTREPTDAEWAVIDGLLGSEEAEPVTVQAAKPAAEEAKAEPAEGEQKGAENQPAAGKPNPAENTTEKPAPVAKPDPKVELEDLFWALLNSREMLFNH